MVTEAEVTAALEGEYDGLDKYTLVRVILEQAEQFKDELRVGNHLHAKSTDNQRDLEAEIAKLNKLVEEICSKQRLTHLMDEIKKLNEQVNAKNTALKDIKINAGRDTTSWQWFKKRAKEGLKG